MSTVTSLNYYSFAFNGFVFGGSNSPYQILAVDGLEGLPAIRNQDDNRGYTDGMFTGNDFLSGRTITITMLTLGGNGNSAQKNFDLLQRAILPQRSGTTVLQFQLSSSGGLQRINSRVRTNKTIVDPDYTYGMIKSQYTFFCADPRYYDDTQQVTTMSFNAGTLGRIYNRTYNLTYGGGIASNYAIITNNGWTATYPTIAIQGPIRNPIVGNFTSGQFIALSGTYASTDVINIDLDQKLITLNGASARNLLTGNSQWFAADPGVSEFYLSGTNTVSGQTAATVSYRSAYI